MKKIENNFTVTGFLGKDAEIREFTNSSVARFPLAVSRQERNAEETNRISAFMNIETWRKNENTGSFDQLTKGTMLTIEGYFRPEEWTDKVGVKHNRVVMVAVKFYPPIEKEDVPEKPVKPVKRGCVETMHPLFCINKAPTFPSQGFVMSKRICIFRH